jgi:hypothetical protein
MDHPGSTLRREVIHHEEDQIEKRNAKIGKDNIYGNIKIDSLY